jgi:hypothetical protein
MAEVASAKRTNRPEPAGLQGRHGSKWQVMSQFEFLRRSRNDRISWVFMDYPRSADELAGLKAFLTRLESGQLRVIRVSSLDVTQDEIAVLKREIELLERILKRSKGGIGQPRK